MWTERWHNGARAATLAFGFASWVSACAPARADRQLASAGAAPNVEANGGTGGALPGATQRGGSAGQSAAASGSAGVPAPDPVTDTSECVNGKRVPGGSSIESGGTAPNIPDLATRAATPVPPLSGGTLLALSDGATVAVSEPDRDRVYLVDVGSGAVRNIALQAGDEPGRLVEDAAGRVHVVLRRGGGVVSLDAKLGSVNSRRQVCPAPRGLAYRKATDELHVACAGGELVSLPASDGAAKRTLHLERDLRDVVVNDDGTLLVSIFRKADVLVVGTDDAVVSRMQPGSGMVATLRGALHRTPAVAWRMLSFDAAKGAVLLLHQTGVTDTVDTGSGGYVPDRCGAIVQPGVSLLTPGEASPIVASGLAHFPLAIDLALSPDRQKVALAVAGNGSAQGATVVELPLAAAMPETPGTCADSPEEPAFAPPPGQVVAVSYAPSGVLFAQTREPAALWRSDTGAVTSLASDLRADTGHFLFHANTGGGIACASCHPEGGEDGRVWDFVCVGPRRTQSLRGGIGPTAPFHWDGSETDMGLLLEDVFTNRMAGPLLSDDVKGALRGWVDTIPALPALEGFDPAALARGKALFEKQGVDCATCHAGALFTNDATLDVGTGQALQVPSLRGLAFRAPFMHDGCAATVRDRFALSTCGGGDKHGVTSSLAAAQLDDLSAYLESL